MAGVDSQKHGMVLSHRCVHDCSLDHWIRRVNDILYHSALQT